MVSRKYSESLHATETGISSGLMGHLARIQALYGPRDIPHVPSLLGVEKSL